MTQRQSFLILLCAFLLPMASYAGQPDAKSFRPISAEELKMSSEPLAPGAPAIILYRQVDRDDNIRTPHEDNYVRIKILTEEGRKYADVEIPFVKGERDVIGIKARTIRPDGSVANYEGKVFEKSVVKAKGLKYMAKTFTLPDVQVGGVIEYYYTIDLPEYTLYDSHWVLSDELFTKSAGFSLKPYTEWTCAWTWHRLPTGTGEPKEGSDHVIRMQASNIPAFQTEDYMPPANELKSRVDFTYYESVPEKDPEKFWKNVGKKRNDAMESFIGKRKAMEQAVAEILSATDAPEVKLQKIYARVQQIRNTSYELSKTEQEAKRSKEKDINNVEDLWKRGYGSGSQLTWLFLALARAAGFDAYGVWVSERANYFFNVQIRDANKLDENVVLVKLNGKDLYFDPGAAFTPFGLLPWSETGVHGLRLDKEGGSWVQTTLPPRSASRIEHKANFQLTEDGSLEGTLTLTLTGLEASWARLDQRHADAAERKKYLEDLVKERVPATIEVDLINKPEWNSSAPALSAEFKLKIPGWASAAGRRTMFQAGIFGAAEKRLFDHAERVHPIYFSFPFEREDDVTITLPLGWEVGSIPAVQSQGGEPVLYALQVEKDNGSVHLKRKVGVSILLLDTKYYGALRTFFQIVRSGDEQQIVLQPMGTRTSK